VSSDLQREQLCPTENGLFIGLLTLTLEGAMYAFPKIDIPAKACAAATAKVRLLLLSFSSPG